MTAPVQSCRCCGQFDIGVKICVDDLQHFLINMVRGFKYFHNVELHSQSDKFQTKWIFYREHTKQKHNFYCVADTKKRCFCFFGSLLKIQFAWNSSDAFAVIVPKTSFSFCSCSKLLQLKFAKKFLQGNANCPAPNTVIGAIKVANKSYLPYL